MRAVTISAGHSCCCIFSADEGADEGTLVTEACKVPFKLTGRIGEVTIGLEDVKTAHHHEKERARRVATLQKGQADRRGGAG